MLREAQQEGSRGEWEEPADVLPGNKLCCCVSGDGFSQESLTMILCFFHFHTFIYFSYSFWTFSLFVLFSACEGNTPSHVMDAASNICKRFVPLQLWD